MKLGRSILLSVLASFFVGSALAQSTATLSGTVADPSGAVLPNAQVIVHSLSTGLDRVIMTDGAGIYATGGLQGIGNGPGIQYGYDRKGDAGC
jgi:hypothetical protein